MGIRIRVECGYFHVKRHTDNFICSKIYTIFVGSNKVDTTLNIGQRDKFKFLLSDIRIKIMTTEQQFDKAISLCRNVFVKKLSDYGAAWRIMRQQSVTDQIFIKASRIRNIEQGNLAQIDEDIPSELIGVVNYSVIGLIQLHLGYADTVDITESEAIVLYDRFVAEAKQLMTAKNHDYNEAWRMMRVGSYTDLILQKINRTKTIEDNNGHTLISEGIDANYYDMLNYAVFYIIKNMETQDDL